MNPCKGGESTVKKLIRKDNGSITLEAAMVLPFFMLFIVFLATLIRIAVADMALYKAAAETNEIIVAHAYPVEVAWTGATDLAETKLKSLEPDDLDVEEVLSWGTDALEFFGIDWQGQIDDFFSNLGEEAVLPVLKSKFEEAAGDTFFDSDNLDVTITEMPSISEGRGDFLEIEVTYEIPISLPFLNETLILSKTAAERYWTGA
jgi:hypothetical protein